MSQFRAKYRVLNHHVWQGGSAIEARPVHVKHSPEDKEGSEENALFFQSTPGGKLYLSVAELSEFPIGQAVYIDFQPDEGGSWRTRTHEIGPDGAFVFRLSQGDQCSTFEANITSWRCTMTLLPLLMADQERIIRHRREHQDLDYWRATPPPMKWRVVVTPAPG